MTDILLSEWVFDCLQDDRDFLDTYLTKGLGSGGTYGGCTWHTVMCKINRESRFSWAVAPTYQQVVDTLIPTFTEVFHTEFQMTEGVDFEVVASGRPLIRLLRTNQEIHFRSANRADRMVGPSISHVMGTEPGLWQESAFQKINQRLRCPKAKRRQRLLEGTPEGLGNHWEKIANFPEGDHETRNAKRIILHTSDNEHLPEGYIPNLKGTYSYDKAKLESYLYGTFVPFTKGTAYWEFFDSRNVKSDLLATKTLPVMLCWDFGKSPIPWVAMQRQPHQTRSGYLFHRFAAVAEGDETSRGLMDACVDFMTQFPPSQWADVPIHIYGDPSGYAGQYSTASDSYDQIYQYLKEKYRTVEIRAAKSAPTVQARLERVNALLANEMYVVASKCKNLIISHTQSSLKNGLWQLDKPKEKDVTHYADATGYPLFQETREDELVRGPSKRVYGTNLGT